MGFKLINKELTVSGIYLLFSLFVKRKNRLRSWISGIGEVKSWHSGLAGAGIIRDPEGVKGRVVILSWAGRPGGLPPGRPVVFTDPFEEGVSGEANCARITCVASVSSSASPPWPAFFSFEHSVCRRSVSP